MFILESKHKRIVAKLQGELLGTKIAIAGLTKEWNALVKRINSKGGEDFMQDATVQVKTPQFDSDEIKRLLMLCHPDKHNGKEMAVTLTKKLLELHKSKD